MYAHFLGNSPLTLCISQSAASVAKTPHYLSGKSKGAAIGEAATAAIVAGAILACLALSLLLQRRQIAETTRGQPKSLEALEQQLIPMESEIDLPVVWTHQTKVS